MKKFIIGVLLGLVLAVALSYYSRAAEIKRLTATSFQPIAITGTMYAGDAVINYNLGIPATLIDSGGNFCFAVTDASNFMMICKDKEGYELSSVVGGRKNYLSSFSITSDEIVVMIRGALCAVASTYGVSGLYISNENLPPVWSWLNSTGAQISFRPLSAVFFADSFMRLTNDDGDWNNISGTWKIVSLPNPSRSANAFRLSGEAKDQVASSVLSLPNWDNYRAEVSLRPKSNAGAGGFIFDYVSDRNYKAVLLSTNKDSALRVIHFLDGIETTLSTAEGTLSTDQWYDLELRHAFGRMAVYLGEREVLNFVSPRISSGKFGLIVSPFGLFEFDDLDVRSLTPSESASLLPIAANGQNGGASHSTLAQSAAMWHKFGDVNVTLSAFSFASPSMGIAFLPIKLGDGSIVNGKLSWPQGASGGVFLQGISSDGETVVALPSYKLTTAGDFFGNHNGAKPAVRAGNCDYEIRVEKGHAFVSFSGDSSFSEVVPLRNGQLVLGIAGDNGFTARDNSIFSTAPGRIMLMKNEIFSHETTMRNWNDDSLHWKRDLNKTETGFFFVNERVFSKKLEATMTLEDSHIALPKYKISVALPQQADSFVSGFVFSVLKDNAVLSATLSYKGEEIWNLPYESDSVIRSFGIYRSERYILCIINGKVFRSYISPSELGLSMVGYGSSPFSAKSSCLEVNSDSTYEYLFNTAPSEWQVGSGIWEVLNRWQCDPRWSWFSGDSPKNPNKPNERLAMLWWRRQLEGDFTFEMYFGFKMDNIRGDKYSYARDVNISLVPDTADLVSGYNFVIGGQIGKRANAGSWVQRGSEKIPFMDNSDTTISRYAIDASASHRFWHHYMLTRRGNRFTLQFTDTKKTQTLFDFTDNDPLPFNRIGLWTYDCGLMISRVRIQTSGYAPMINQLTEKAVRPRTIYDLADF